MRIRREIMNKKIELQKLDATSQNILLTQFEGPIWSWIWKAEFLHLSMVDVRVRCVKHKHKRCYFRHSRQNVKMASETIRKSYFR